jgi:hypothetical protein
MRYRLRTLLIATLVCGAVALVSPDFGTGFREGFLGGMNRDFIALQKLIQSPVIKSLFVIGAIYLLAFFPLMWLNARSVIGMKFFVRLYMPIWIAMGAVLLASDWLRERWPRRNQ